MENDAENILPLYEMAKNKLYESYIQLQRQAVSLKEPKQSKSRRRARRIEFTKRFDKFFFNVIAVPEYKRLDSEVRELVEFYSQFGERLFTKYEHIKRSVMVCAIIIEGLNITRITNLSRKRAF